MLTSGGSKPGPTSWSIARILSAAVPALVLGATPAIAQPAPPDTAEGAVEQRVRADAELLTEQWHAAKDALVDQVSVLKMLASEQRIVLDELLAVVEDTAAAHAEADAATPQALAERIVPGVEGPDGPIPGGGAGVVALRAAITQLGKPYRWGAEGPGGFDCSGLTSWAFSTAGVTLPRSSEQQARVGRSVPCDEMRAGDLVFFHFPVSRIGIPVDNDTMINSPQTGDVVQYSSLTGRDFAGARRL